MSDPWNPDRYSKGAAFVYESATDLLKLLDPKPGERILDLGCGSGELSLKIQEIGSDVIGIDSSPAMVEKAIEKGLVARVVDGHEMDFDDSFDAVFSNAALHWMSQDPRRVVQNIYRSLKANGRFVAEFGGEGNVRQILHATENVFQRHSIPFVNPWYFPSKEAYSSLLQSEGFIIHDLVLFPRPTSVRSGVIGWLKLFGHTFFTSISSSLQSQLLQEIEKEFLPVPLDSTGYFVADYVRLRVKATKNESNE